MRTKRCHPDDYAGPFVYVIQCGSYCGPIKKPEVRVIRPLLAPPSFVCSRCRRSLETQTRNFTNGKSVRIPPVKFKMIDGQMVCERCSPESIGIPWIGDSWSDEEPVIEDDIGTSWKEQTRRRDGLAFWGGCE